MAYDLLIQGGIVIDPEHRQQAISDLAIANGKIVAVAPDLSGAEAAQVVDAHGLYVTPGLIDLHTHCYWGATYWGIEADPIAAQSGVTTWLDAGSAGAYNFPGFRRYIAQNSRVRIFALLNLSVIGLTARTYEVSNLDYCNIEAGLATVEANRDLILGIKVRIDADTARGTGLEPLRRARQLAERAQLPLMVHIGIAPPELKDIASLLRPGDILTHCYCGHTNRLIDEQGHVYPFIRALWEQGVILDLGHGTGAFSYESAEAMLADGIPPDVISSDIHQLAALGPMYDLPTTLSKFLNLGLTLPDVIARATIRPAQIIGHPELGTLQTGTPADLALFRLEEGNYTFYDTAMSVRHGSKRLIHVATYIDGCLLSPTSASPSHFWAKSDLPVHQRSLLT